MTRAAEQLAAIVRELDEARDRAHRTADGLGPATWARRPPGGGWSVSECLQHLNLTSGAFLGRLQQGVAEARAKGLAATGGPYRLDVVGWLLCRLLEPPYRLRVKTSAPFVPGGIAPASEVLASFDRWHDALVECVRSAEGLAVDRVRVSSPFSARVKYSVYSSLRLIPVHQRRHLWQAEQVLRAQPA
jgi:hypothetical protein